MSTNHHTVIGTGAAANASVFNSPLAQLDSAITTNATSITGLASTITTLQNSIILGGAAVTLTNGAANAAQKVVTVDSSAQFVAGCYVEYTLVGGVVERNTVDTVDSSTQITLITNIGTGGIADNSPVAVIPVGFYHATMGRYHVADFGAVGDGSTDDTAAFVAALAAIRARTGVKIKSSVLQLTPGANYKITGSLNFTDIENVTVDGGDIGAKITYADADGVLFDCLGAARLTFRNLTIYGDTSTAPAVCFSFGRSTTSGGEDSGVHLVERVNVLGYWSIAAVYNVSSELMHLSDIWLLVSGPDTAGAKYGVYCSGYDDLSVGSEYATRSATASMASPWINNFNIGSANFTTATFIPLTFQRGAGAITVRDGYCYTYDSQPAIKFVGSIEGLLIENMLVEGVPDKSIHFAAYSGAGTINAATIINVALGAYAAVGIYSDAGTTIYRLLVRNCTGGKSDNTSNITFAGAVNDSDIDTWWTYSAGVFTAANFYHSRLHVREHTLTITSALGSAIFNDATSSNHYYHLQTGLRVGTIAATNLAEINDIRTASKTWSPTEIADDGQAATTVTVSGVTQADGWFCMAHYAGISGYSGWDMSAVAGDGAVGVSIVNRTGGALTPTGTLSVVAWKITAA